MMGGMGYGGTSYYFCGNCDLNFTQKATHTRCPNCGTPTTIKTSYHPTLVPDDEAARMLSYVSFEEYLEKETDAMRDQRRAREAQEKLDREDRLTRFDDVISADNGFQPWELERLQELHDKLAEHD